MGSPSSIVMLGFGNGTFNGSPSLICTLGYGSAESSTAVIGRWANVIECRSANERIDAQSTNKRIEI